VREVLKSRHGARGKLAPWRPPKASKRWSASAI